MRLRTRIAVTTLLVVVPMLVVVALLRAQLQGQATTAALAGGLVEFMRRGGRAVCERAPGTWQVRAMLPVPLRDDEVRGDQPILMDLPDTVAEEMHVGPLGTFAYDAQFAARNPSAPPIAQELRDRLARDDVAIRRVPGRPPLEEVLVRMPWRDGPCAIALMRRPELRPDESWLRALPVRIWAPVVLLSVIAVVIGIGPAVRRIRRLTREVRVSASASYRPEISVRGGDEIGDLARAFRDAAHEIRAQIEVQAQRERALREFLENTTHDVMTPLTVLGGHLATLAASAAREPAGTLDLPGLRARITAAMDEAHYMASLIHNLELAAKLEAGEPELRDEPFELNALIERVAARHHPIACNHGVSLERATPEARLYATGDVTFAEQAVSNLVVNAIQHVEPGGHVAITLDRVAAERFAIKVIDDGPGVPTGELDRIVERGLRAGRARTRAPSGRGLGLDIVHRAVRLHAWELALVSLEPRGLSVTIAGPLSRGPGRPSCSVRYSR